MLTLFTTAKPFEGHSGVIQRNALQSWKRLHPDVEVILFGEDAGSAEIANELGLGHEAFVERNKFGTKRFDCCRSYLQVMVTAVNRAARIIFSRCTRNNSLAPH